MNKITSRLFSDFLEILVVVVGFGIVLGIAYFRVFFFN